jgi:diguanylate cyclase (GGDEF)-like protein
MGIKTGKHESVRKLVFGISWKLVLAIAMPVLIAVSIVTALSIREFANDKTKYVLYVLHLSTTEVCRKVAALPDTGALPPADPNAHPPINTDNIAAPVTSLAMDPEIKRETNDETLLNFISKEFSNLEFSNNYLIRLKDSKFIIGDSSIAKAKEFSEWLRRVEASPISEATSEEIWGGQAFITSACRFNRGSDVYLSLHAVPKGKALRPVRLLAESVIYVALAVLIVSLLMSYFLARSLSRPIATLAEASDEIAAGNFAHQWNIRNRDEIGILSDHLDILRVKLRDREIQLGKANQLANMDHLTKLYNRRFLEQQLEQAFTLAARYDRPLGLVYFDLDHFKSVNDTYGHDAGDVVLQEIGALLRESVRKTDFAARVGGEEFCVVLPETDSVGALAFARSMRQRLKTRKFKLPNNKEISATISVGVANRIEDEITSWKQLITSADELAYKSKRGGRDRINHGQGEVF